jgi:hypothetical protein
LAYFAKIEDYRKRGERVPLFIGKEKVAHEVAKIIAEYEDKEDEGGPPLSEEQRKLLERHADHFRTGATRKLFYNSIAPEDYHSIFDPMERATVNNSIRRVDRLKRIVYAKDFSHLLDGKRKRNGGEYTDAEKKKYSDNMKIDIVRAIEHSYIYPYISRKWFRG